MQSGTARSAIDQAVLDASAAATLAALVRTKRFGIALMVMSAGLLTVGDATAKWLSTTYPIGEIIFIRGLLIVMLLAAMRLPMGLPD